MSLYRTLIAAVAAMGLATVAFAADEATNVTKSTTAEATQAIQIADASQATQPAGEEVKVNLNKATVNDLKKVKGLNIAKAKAIVAFRKKNGEFKSVDDLKQVKGFKKMNDETLKKIQDQLSV